MLWCHPPGCSERKMSSNVCVSWLLVVMFHTWIGTNKRQTQNHEWRTLFTTFHACRPAQNWLSPLLKDTPAAKPRYTPNSGCPGRLKPVLLKPVGRMSILGEFDLPGVLPGCLLGRPFCASKQGLQAPGSELTGKCLGIPRTETWPKMAHADDSVYCNWVKVWPNSLSLYICSQRAKIAAGAFESSIIMQALI